MVRKLFTIGGFEEPEAGSQFLEKDERRKTKFKQVKNSENSEHSERLSNKY